MLSFFKRLDEGIFDIEDLKYITNELANFHSYNVARHFYCMMFVVSLKLVRLLFWKYISLSLLLLTDAIFLDVLNNPIALKTIYTPIVTFQKLSYQLSCLI